MSNTKKRASRAVLIKATNSSMDILKAEGATAISEDPYAHMYAEEGIIEPDYPFKELLKMVEYSTILQQCIDAYKRNIPGFGAEIQYTLDVKETPEMIAQYDALKEIMEFFNFDKSFEDVWADAIEHREKCGNGFIEIIRDGRGLPAGGENVDPTYMRVTTLTEPIDVKYERFNKDGQKISYTRKKRFRRYVQIVGTEKVWFKQFGDPRFMNKETGEFTSSHNGDLEANEIIHLKIGDGPYGVPRWIGQLIHMYGARKAEELNYNYFDNGRHTPAAVIVSNGMLTEESLQQLQAYANEVKGVDNAHKFLILEAEGLEDGILPGEDRQGVKVDIKPLAEILQQDALFLDYDEKSREKVQSAFRLPDLYVGRSKDFNRATADTAREVTEEQVFEPERNSLEFIINNILFQEHELNLVKIRFKSPEISNATDQAALLTVLNNIGSVSPNDTRDLVGKIVGKDLDPFDDEMANVPLLLQKQIQSAQQHEQNLQIQVENAKREAQQATEDKKLVERELEKAQNAHYKDEFIGTVKSVRKFLEELKNEKH